MDCSTPGFPVHHQLLKLTQTYVHQVSDAIQPSILCRPLLLLPSIFPSIRVFSDESVLHIRWPNYWSFSFSISPSNEYSGLISCRIDWFNLRAVQGTLNSLLQYHIPKPSTPTPRSVEKLSSVKPVPGVKKVGDCCFKSLSPPFSNVLAVNI